MSCIMNDAKYSTFATWTMESILPLRPRRGGIVIVSHNPARNSPTTHFQPCGELLYIREFHYIPPNVFSDPFPMFFTLRVTRNESEGRKYAAKVGRSG